jgi:hypothetical protein
VPPEEFLKKQKLHESPEKDLEAEAKFQEIMSRVREMN